VASAASSISRVGFTARRPDEEDHYHSHQDATRDRHGAQHVHADPCGHSHGPQPQTLAGPGGWSRGISAVVAVGLRPCSGAILVLVFALVQGLFPLGVAAGVGDDWETVDKGIAPTRSASATFVAVALAAVSGPLSARPAAKLPSAIATPTVPAATNTDILRTTSATRLTPHPDFRGVIASRSIQKLNRELSCVN
jgi:hypothetical protein